MQLAAARVVAAAMAAAITAVIFFPVASLSGHLSAVIGHKSGQLSVLAFGGDDVNFKRTFMAGQRRRGFSNLSKRTFTRPHAELSRIKIRNCTCTAHAVRHDPRHRN